MVQHRCHICGSSDSRQWYRCVVCEEELCEECAVRCDKCHRYYCIGGECGDDYQDENVDYNFCFKCK